MLNVESISTIRGRAEVLSHVSMEVREGEVVCLVGRNGAGKTTMAETIMGHLPMTTGRITLAGRDISRLPPHQRAKLGLGYTPDYCGIFPKLTVGENLNLSTLVIEQTPEQTQERREQIYAIFPEVRDLESRLGTNLSGGQRKMVAISRTMTLFPSLIVLDEAFEGLAPVIVSRFTEAVSKIKDLGISLLIAESHLAAASKIADRVYAIERGEVIFEGTPAQIAQDKTVMRTISG